MTKSQMNERRNNRRFSFGNVTTYDGPISIIGCIFHDSFDLDGAECQSGTIISGNDYFKLIQYEH